MSVIVAFGMTAPVMAQTAAPGSVTATEGAMLHDVNGTRLGHVYKVMPDGSVKIIFDTRIVTVPGTTLSMVDGSLTTSMTKNQVSDLKN